MKVVYALIQEWSIEYEGTDKQIIGITTDEELAKKWADTPLILPKNISADSYSQSYEKFLLDYITGDNILHGSGELELLFLNEIEELNKKTNDNL